MPSNKERLYVALYARETTGEPTMPNREDTYHWAFIIGPKEETSKSVGERFHVRERYVPEAGQWLWQYDGQSIGLSPTSMLLVRILVAKVEDKKRLKSIFEKTPLRPDKPGWNCVEWTKEAYETAIQDKDALGTSVKKWKEIRETAMWYVELKDRYDDRFGERLDPTKVPTFDRIENQELIE